MSKVFLLVKYALLVFSMLAAILGVLMFFFTLTRAVYTFQHWLWAIPFGICGLAVLGGYGTCAEKKVPLIVFCVLTWIITVIMVILGILFILIFRLDVHSLTTASDAHPFIMMLGFIFGMGAFMFVAGLLSMIMVIQMKERSDAQQELDPTEGGRIPLQS